jgi:hypothetical protein
MLPAPEVEWARRPEQLACRCARLAFRCTRLGLELPPPPEQQARIQAVPPCHLRYRGSASANFGDDRRLLLPAPASPHIRNNIKARPSPISRHIAGPISSPPFPRERRLYCRRSHKAAFPGCLRSREVDVLCVGPTSRWPLEGIRRRRQDLSASVASPAYANLAAKVAGNCEVPHRADGSFQNAVFWRREREFHIYSELSEEPQGNWLFGYVEFYLGNRLIGKEKFPTSLGDVWSALVEPQRGKGKRFNKTLFQMTTTNALALSEQCVGFNQGPPPGRFAGIWHPPPFPASAASPDSFAGIWWRRR